MAITDFSKKKQIEVASVTGTPTISRTVPLKITSGDDTTTGTGWIVLDWTNIASEADIGIYDQNDNLLDYYFESFNATDKTAIIQVQRDWVRDGSVQLQVAYGNGLEDRSKIASTIFSKESGLKGGWLLNEESGNALDVSGNGNDGTVTGVTQEETGIVGGAYNFDGDGDYIQVADDPSLRITRDLTLSVWLKSPDFTNEGDEALVLFSKNYVDNEYYYHIANASGSDLWVGGEKVGLYWDGDLTTDTWYLITITIDSANKDVYGYLNGSNFETKSYTNDRTESTAPLYIGSKEGASRFWKGLLDDARIYNTRLSSDEVLALYDVTKETPDFFSQQAGETVNYVLSLSHDYSGATGEKTISITPDVNLEDITEINLSGGQITSPLPLTNLEYCINLGNLSLANNPNLMANDISNLLINFDGFGLENCTLDVQGCNGGELTYDDLTSEAQNAYDNLETNKGWDIAEDVITESGEMFTASDAETDSVWAGNVVHVTDPGDGNSIHTNLESAFDSASTGDMLLLPAGEFIVEDGTNYTMYLSDTGKDKIYIRGRGSGYNGTKLKRGELVEVDKMVSIQLDNDVEMSDIWWQGAKPRFYEGDTGHTSDQTFCSAIGNCNIYLHDCKFSWFTRYINSITMRYYAGDWSDCVVSNNEFIDNYVIKSDGELDGGEAISVSRNEAGDTTWEDVEPGNGNFVFFEDNYMCAMYQCVVGGWGGKYVSRHNYAERMHYHGNHNMHGGAREDDHPPTRLIEVYENIFIKPPEDDLFYNSGDEGMVISFGGEAVVHNNLMIGFSVGMKIVVGERRWDDSYPAENWQAGYESGVDYGPDHTGTDPDTYGAGDWFIWENTYRNMGENPTKLTIYQPDDDRYVQEGRDYHFVERPNYTPYTYPHPKRTT